MAVHIRFHKDGHARLIRVLPTGRAGGYWCGISADVLGPGKTHENVFMWEMHPDGGDTAMRDSVKGPWVAKARITGAYLVKWVDKRRVMIEFDVRSLECYHVDELGISPPRFLMSGTCYTDADPF